jgi:hypothetical protein
VKKDKFEPDEEGSVHQADRERTCRPPRSTRPVFKRFQFVEVSERLLNW